MEQVNILDVTLLEPRQKHPTIFARFDQLLEGESLVIHNDHDPKPLYYQLLGERGAIFTWDYLEQGPEWWKVRISRNVSDANGETLGQIAARDLRKAQVFKKYGLDFCCGGRKTVAQACAEKGLDLAAVSKALCQAEEPIATRPLPYNDWSLDFLADYIVNTHHSYIKGVLPDITAYAGKVARVHGDRHPELLTIHQLVAEMAHELSSHLLKEEQVLFPYIREMVKLKHTGQAFPLQYFATVRQPIDVMETEHASVGRNLDIIRRISDNYTLPEDACASYSLLYRMLDEFEDDLHIHVHLENNILFPKAVQLEKVLNNANA